MGYLWILILFVVATSQKSLIKNSHWTCGSSEVLDTRVVGGGKIRAEYAPWNIILEIKNETKPDRIMTHCGGNIIATNFVLTAAHCFLSDRVEIRYPEEVNVYIGRSSIRPKNEPIRVKHFILHERWYKTNTVRENAKLGHDIALLQLETDLTFSDTIQPICLPSLDVNLAIGRSVIMNGFGLVKKTPFEIKAEHLQSGSMEIKDKYACNSSWSGRIEGDQLCALGEGLDSCNGDSGSGLTIYVNKPGKSSVAVLVGLTSFGQRWCEGEKPAVYTNVLSHVDWIEQKILDITNKESGECVTISGPAAGFSCIFPFTFKGKTYNTCTLDGTPEHDRKPWCSTKVDSLGNHVARQNFWGRCKADCSQHSETQNQCGIMDTIRRFTTNSLSWPWAALLIFGQGSNHIQCSGTLISSNIILTAAHCVQHTKYYERSGYLPNSLQVGNYETNDIEITEVIIHPLYTSSGRFPINDIALVKLGQSFKYDKENIRPACLPDSYIDQNLPIILANNVVDCNTGSWIGGLGDTQMCTSDWGNSTGICNGKIGGALMSNKLESTWSVVGILSFRQAPCQGKQFGAVLTRVDKYLEWIKEHM